MDRTSFGCTWSENRYITPPQGLRIESVGMTLSEITFITNFMLHAYYQSSLDMFVVSDDMPVTEYMYRSHFINTDRTPDYHFFHIDYEELNLT